MWCKYLKWMGYVLTGLIFVSGVIFAPLASRAEEQSMDILLTKDGDINQVKAELEALGDTVILDEIPEINLLRLKTNSDAVQQAFAAHEQIEFAGKMTEVFVEDQRLNQKNASIKALVFPETVTLEDTIDEFDLLDQLAWYKHQMTAEGQALDFSKGQGVRIGLIDSGVDYSHPLLSQVVDTFTAQSFTDDDPTINDVNGHGTMVAGIIAQLAPEAIITPYKVISAESGESFWTLEAMVQAVKDGQNILNMSLGTYKYETIEEEKLTIEAFERGVEYAREHGVLIVSSAGNNGMDLDAAYQEMSIRHLPSSIPGVLSTSALSFEHLFATYSNSGSNVQYAAPGGEYVFVDGLLDAGHLIYTAYPKDRDNGLGMLGLPQGYMFSAGTSLSAPCLTAVVADYYAYYQKMTGNDPILETLQNDFSAKALDLGIPGKDAQYGNGLPNLKDSYEMIPDLLPPDGHFQEQLIEVNTEILSEELVTEIYDNSEKEVSTAFVEQPIWNKLGKQMVQVALKDASGNSKILEGALAIQDTIPPQATLKDVEIVQGAEISPEMFIETIEDNHDSKQVTVEFVESIDTNQVGTQNVQLRLLDVSKNETLLTGKITIKKKEASSNSSTSSNSSEPSTTDVTATNSDTSESTSTTNTAPSEEGISSTSDRATSLSEGKENSDAEKETGIIDSDNKRNTDLQNTSTGAKKTSGQTWSTKKNGDNLPDTSEKRNGFQAAGYSLLILGGIILYIQKRR